MSLQRRTTRLLLFAAALVVANCASTDRPLSDQRSDPGLLGPEAPDPNTASRLTEALESVGVDVSSAPEEAVALAGAQFCGVAGAGGPIEASTASPVLARQCLLDAHVEAQPAVLVEVTVTVEGDPIVRVVRALSDGTVALFEDATRDTFGSGGWHRYGCQRLVTTDYREFPLPDSGFRCR
jgi:hypothetical protein